MILVLHFVRYAFRYVICYDMLGIVSSLVLVILLRPLLCRSKTLLSHRVISRNELHLEVSGNGHQCSLELIVINIVGVRWLRLARNDFVRSEDADEGRVE